MNFLKPLLSLTAAFLIAVTAPAQEILSDTQVKDLVSGNKITFNEAFVSGKITVVSFWTIWCATCKKKIKNIRTKLEEWRKEADFNYMTVSIDETRAEGAARSYAKAQGWDFPLYIDSNSCLKRSLNFQDVPFTIIVDKAGKVVFTQSGYKEGDETDVFTKVKELVMAR